MVVVDDNMTGDFFIFPKTEKGWKLPWRYSLRTLFILPEDTQSLTFKRLRGTQENYALLYLYTPGETAQVTDNRGTVFSRYDISTLALPEPHSLYCAYIGDPDDDYELTINGEIYSYAALLASGKRSLSHVISG